VLKYPDGGFIWLLILAMTAEGWAFGHILPYVATGPHNIASSIVFTLIFIAVVLTVAYYLAKGMTWLLYKLFPPQS
jgi:hypothetical protein